MKLLFITFGTLACWSYGMLLVSLLIGGTESLMVTISSYSMVGSFIGLLFLLPTAIILQELKK